MDHTTKSLLAYFSDREKYWEISKICYLIDDGQAKGEDKTKLLSALSRDIAKHLAKSRPRKKGKKSRIRPPITFGPADMSEIN